jgi:N-acyl-D-aspartate/D-glutamate deacylase
MLDYVIKGGTIVDGTGADRRQGDVGVRDGVIVEVGGSITESAKETIDADGAIVTPGWVDVHTHYDGQVSWDEVMDPSAGNGATTIVMGNCGVGFAPVRPGGEKSLIELMEGVEDIPGTALYEGIEWGRWESFPEYMDYIASRRYSLDIGAQIAHGSLR